MDNLSNKELEAQLLASAKGQAVASDGSKLLIDRLHDLFGADDLVKIKNFTKHKIGWVYCDKRTTRVEQPNEFTRRVWQGEQKARVVDAGKSVIVPGWEAFVALNRFFDTWLQTEYPDKLVAYTSSPTIQQQFIDSAYGGVQDINDLNNDEPVNVKKEVEDDLGLTNAKEPKQSATTKEK